MDKATAAAMWEARQRNDYRAMYANPEHEPETMVNYDLWKQRREEELREWYWFDQPNPIFTTDIGEVRLNMLTYLKGGKS